MRWGQTNLNELDPARYDGEWWRQHWRRTRVQGLVVNAGGIVAYYPSRYALQYRAEHLGERDLFGEIVAMAREEGLAILARMDSNRALPAFYQAHPDWFAANAEGQPSVTQGRYQACVNSPYYHEYLPGILREIIDLYHPEGFTDNSWTGLGRRFICHCPHCVEKFGRATGLDLPRAVDWTDPVYRRWIKWSYACRIKIWELNNRVCREQGGPDCLWLGMINGDPIGSHLSFCDLKEIGARAEMLMSDQQSRKGTGFEQNGVSGKLLHGVLHSATGDGWEKVIPESMATYVRGEQAFRKAANPPLETRKWMVEGYAGGISPWWHHIGAFQWDRRQFHTAEPLMRWHEANERYLYHRRPVANVGLLWSHENIDFYGRDDSQARVLYPWYGYTKALTRARIPFLPVHADHINRFVGPEAAQQANELAVLILPDLAAMSDKQCQAVRRYVEGGGSLVASANSGRYDEWGEPRKAFPLEDLLGVRHTGVRLGVEGQPSSNWEVHSGHTYLRLPHDESAAPPHRRRFQRDRHPGLWRHAAAGRVAAGRGGGRHLCPGFSDLSTGVQLDANPGFRGAGHRRPRAPRRRADRLSGRRRGPLLWAQGAARPWRPADPRSALGGAVRCPITRGRAGYHRLPPLPPGGAPDPAPDQPQRLQRLARLLGGAPARGSTARLGVPGRRVHANQRPIAGGQDAGRSARRRRLGHRRAVHARRPRTDCIRVIGFHCKGQGRLAKLPGR